MWWGWLRSSASKVNTAVVAVSIAFGSIALSAGHAFSAETVIRVKVDEARIVPLVSSPATVIIGNPSVADASLQNGNLLVVMGRNYGSTNVIALNTSGDQIASFELNVVSSGTHELSLYRGSARASYNCAPRCEPKLNAGDHNGVFGNTLTQQTGKMGLATGAAGEEKADE